MSSSEGDSGTPALGTYWGSQGQNDRLNIIEMGGGHSPAFAIGTYDDFDRTGVLFHGGVSDTFDSGMDYLDYGSEIYCY